jgi:LCP family protein required for cell wall assembly
LDPANPVSPTTEGRSPTVAAALSFVWPGLGHWYTGRPRAALLFALPLLGVLAVLAVQIAGGLGRVAGLLISPSSAITVFVLVLLLGAWREIAMLDAVTAIRPRGAWRRAPSAVAVGLLSLAILVPHLWAGSVAWAFYDAGTRIFVGSGEGADAAAAPTPVSTPAPGETATDPATVPSADPADDYVAAPFATPATPTSRITILLTGIDSAETRDHALTDTLIVASIDPTTSDVALISFPRDISNFPLVDGRTYTGKINSFMTYVRNHPTEFADKPLVELVHELSFLVGAPINYYAAVDLAGFRRMIDAVGGVTVTVETAINDARYDWLDGRRGFTLSAGVHKLDGDRALAYVRSRYSPGDNDFNRSRRQQQVLLALARKLTSPAMLPRIPELVQVAGDTIRTNFPSGRVSEMLDLARSIDPDKVTQVVLGPPYAFHPPDSTTGGIYTLQLNMDKLAAVSIKVFGDASAYKRP